MNVPLEIIAGMTYEWTEISTAYPASAGYTAKFRLAGTAAAVAAVTNPNGEDYDFTLSAVITGAYTVGNLEWMVFVTKGSGGTLVQHVLGTGQLAVKPNPDSPATYDSRSTNKKALDAIEAVTLGRASKDQQSYTIAGRTLERTPIPELLILGKHYRRLYRKELRKEKIARGESPGRKIYVRFGGL